jgi:uncharacterized membrane protein YjjP (DUF1212 family)
MTALQPPHHQTRMNLQERSDLILRLAQVLHTNGQSTDETLSAARRLGQCLAVSGSIVPRWGELLLHAQDGDSQLTTVAVADPTGIDMHRVAASLRALDDMCGRRHSPSGATFRTALVRETRSSSAPVATTPVSDGPSGSMADCTSNSLASQTALATCLEAIARSPATPTWLFALAASAGAAALSVLFGVEHVTPVALIAVSAAIGAVLRRTIARYSDNSLLQPFCAALVAGVLGAFAVRLDLSSSLRLVAVCPCLILVPGPHVLNGAMDLIAARIHLGAGVATGALVACLFVGAVLTPVARRHHMPFAAVGFAAVVSMMPDVFLFRLASGLVQLADASSASLALFGAAISDAITAATVILAMAAGLIVPKLAIGRIMDR